MHTFAWILRTYGLWNAAKHSPLLILNRWLMVDVLKKGYSSTWGSHHFATIGPKAVLASRLTPGCYINRQTWPTSLFDLAKSQYCCSSLRR